MEPKLPIYPGRLSEGQVEKLDEELEPALFESDEARFSQPILAKGEAYMAGDVLIIRLHLETVALVPCRICAEEVEVPLQIPDFYTAEEGVTSGVFDCLPLIRESLLLELPPFVECHGGHCPHRPEMLKYLEHPEKDGFHPFKDL